MGRRSPEELDPKSQLVREICSLSSAFATCTHRRRHHAQKPVFIDWYLILRINEDSGLDSIRKRYRQLALLLHPDKNKHPNAEIAFKLVSEAYACLSDKTRRRAFNLERWNSFCKECIRKSQSVTCEFPNNVEKNRRDFPANGEKKRGSVAKEQEKSYRVLQALKEVRNRLREEATVIERCLRTHGVSRREFPLFDPFDHRLFPDYPHYRIRVASDFSYLHNGGSRNYWGRKSGCESPIYEVRSETQPSRAKNQGFGF